MNTKVKIQVAVLLLVVGGGLAVCILCRGGGDVSATAAPSASAVPERLAAVRRTAGKSVTVIRTKPVLNLALDGEDDEDEVKQTPEEKRLAEAIEKALDNEDFELAKSCVRQAVACRIPEIRQAMVDTLGWFGQKALVELLPFMADADEDIAESACNEWEMGLSEIEKDSEKLAMVGLVMGVMTDEDFLESLSGEYIGVDEKLAVESLLSVIEGRGSAEGIAKAKETYEFVTGDEFVDRATAEKWIDEEYQPPEKFQLGDGAHF